MAEVTLTQAGSKILLVCGGTAISLTVRGALTLAEQLPMVAHIANAHLRGTAQLAEWQGRARRLRFDSLLAFGYRYTIDSACVAVWCNRLGQLVACAEAGASVDLAYADLLKALERHT